jgi:hypothetical protein
MSQTVSIQYFPGKGPVFSELKHVGRQHHDDGQNKFLQINDSKENLSYIIIRMNLKHWLYVWEEFYWPNFKLHLLRLEMQALYSVSPQKVPSIEIILLL